MLESYFKIALRFLIKNKLYSFINIAGLSLSLSCVILIILYTKDELSFDKFHEDVNSIYLIGIDVRNPDGSSQDKMAITSMLHGPRFKDNLPEIQSYVRLAKTYRNIKLGEDVQSQEVMHADTNLFTFFSFPLLHGNPKTALNQLHSAVISQDMAIRHFGTEDALNKTILLEREGAFTPYVITGVSKRCPQNSSIQFEIVLPPEDDQMNFNWVNLGVNTFLKINEGSDMNVVAAKMQKIFESESKEVMKQVRSYGFTQSFYHQLQPFTDVHLNQEFKAEEGLSNASSPIYSYILSGIAIFILIIACINFVNLTIARSAKRAREIGIRKVVGSGRVQLIKQFLGESFLLCCFSFASGLLVAQLLLPIFNDVVNKELSLSYLMDSRLILSYVILLILTGLLSGFYPAIVLSGYKPVQTLYNQFRLSGKSRFQKTLIVFQFALATIMIIGTMTIFNQFEFLTTKELGFDAENVVRVPKGNLTPRELKVFSEELSKDPNIVLVAPQGHSTMNVKINGESILNCIYETVDENFIDLFKISVADGRNFSPLFPSDSAESVIVNEAFVKIAGWRDPIGEQVSLFDGEKKVVVGVVKDYHFESLKNVIKPQLFVPTSGTQHGPYMHFLVRLKPNSEANSLAHIEKTFKRLFPIVPYTYQFYDDINLKNYEVESKWKKVILLSSLLTVFIAGIGLFGLSILTAESRHKEIGIRKILGATVNAIVFTLFKDLLSLISLSMIVAIPVAYYASAKWLESYPYRTEVGFETFIGAGLLVLIIGLATISYQTIKTALMNPVETLKRE
jgi:putative ABC transport system permease protein